MTWQDSCAIFSGLPDIWDTEAEELLPVAHKLLEYFRTTRPERAPGGSSRISDGSGQRALGVPSESDLAGAGA